jgi:hypothetical protein
MAIKIAGVDVINDDRELVLAKLTDINETINDTAVDVFVYDTSKDSDGGAWRHRTQHTSWYNETLNTSTRGSRKEFPAVAVIVAEASKVTIYDGDDPSLPMWMVFNKDPSNLIGNGSLSSVYAKNAQFAVGTNTGGWGVVEFHLVSEVSFLRWTNGRQIYNGSIAQRNSQLDHTPEGNSALNIANLYVNDVAMTVLPDAPTDPATGLPVPTIAVATDGGVSVIKDDGTVVDIGHSFAADIFTTVSFTDDNRLATFLQGIKDVYVMPIPTSDYSVDLGSDTTTYNEFAAPYLFSTFSFVSPSDLKPLATPDGLAIIRNETGAIQGISQLAEDPTTPANGMVAYTTSDYNTGWMPGDIKLAALADTTAETLSGSELVTNSGFATDTDWTKGTGWTINTTTGVASFDASVSGAGVQTALTQNITTVAGELYIVKATFSSLVNLSGSELLVRCAGSNLVAWETGSANIITDGTYTFSFIALSSTTEVNIRLTNLVEGDETGSVDNVSVRLADPDRSVNGNGLGVHGSITKAAVATGADVVAYSGFSASNYLQQPYNPDLNFGTGDFCVMGWSALVSGTNFGSFFNRESTAGNPAIALRRKFGRLFFKCSATGSETDSGVDWAPNSKPLFFCMVRRSNVLYIYVDAVELYSAANSANVSDVTNNPVFRLGYSSLDAEASQFPLALIRISATAPTADQIRKIYEDERPLFQENAKATLTGNSDAVTALAHDPDTDLLHVSTSGGRSVFQGLRRVEEHTGTNSQSLAAISAVDGLVVEGK